MKLFVAIFSVFVFSTTVFATEICVDVNEGWVGEVKALPGGHIMVSNPVYVFDGETYVVYYNMKNFRTGLCKNFGKTVSARFWSSDRKYGESLNFVDLSSDGTISDVYKSKSVNYITKIQCK